jgi:hypothetical protein
MARTFGIPGGVTQDIGDIPDFSLYSFDPPLEARSEIQCPNCNGWRHLAWWREREVWCDIDLCGPEVTHFALVCPSCLWSFTHCHGPTFKTRFLKV